MTMITLPTKWPSDAVLAARMKFFAENYSDECKTERAMQQCTVVFPTDFKLPLEFRTSIFGDFFRTFPRSSSFKEVYLHSTMPEYLKDKRDIGRPDCRTFLEKDELRGHYIDLNENLNYGDDDELLNLKSSSSDCCNRCRKYGDQVVLTHSSKCFLGGFGPRQRQEEEMGLYCAECAQEEMKHRMHLDTCEFVQSPRKAGLALEAVTPLPRALGGLVAEYCRSSLAELPLKLVSELGVAQSQYHEWMMFMLDDVDNDDDSGKSPHWYINCNVDSLFYGVVLEVDWSHTRRFYQDILLFQRAFLQRYKIDRVEPEGLKDIYHPAFKLIVADDQDDQDSSEDDQDSNDGDEDNN